MCYVSPECLTDAVSWISSTGKLADLLFKGKNSSILARKMRFTMHSSQSKTMQVQACLNLTQGDSLRTAPSLCHTGCPVHATFLKAPHLKHKIAYPAPLKQVFNLQPDFSNHLHHLSQKLCSKSDNSGGDLVNSVTDRSSWKVDVQHLLVTLPFETSRYRSSTGKLWVLYARQNLNYFLHWQSATILAPFCSQRSVSVFTCIAIFSQHPTPNFSRI